MTIHATFEQAEEKYNDTLEYYWQLKELTANYAKKLILKSKSKEETQNVNNHILSGMVLFVANTTYFLQHQFGKQKISVHKEVVEGLKLYHEEFKTNPPKFESQH